jgi:hypothetical protein
VGGGGAEYLGAQPKNRRNRRKQTNFPQFQNVSISNTTKRPPTAFLRSSVLQIFKDFKMKKLALLLCGAIDDSQINVLGREEI